MATLSVGLTGINNCKGHQGLMIVRLIKHTSSSCGRAETAEKMAAAVCYWGYWGYREVKDF